MLWCILFCGWYDRIKMKYWRSFIEIKAAGDWQKRKSIISACARLSLHTGDLITHLTTNTTTDNSSDPQPLHWRYCLHTLVYQGNAAIFLFKGWKYAFQALLYSILLYWLVVTRLCRTVISLLPKNRRCDPSTTDKIPNPRAPLNQWMGSAWTLSDAWSLVQIRNQESGIRMTALWSVTLMRSRFGLSAMSSANQKIIFRLCSSICATPAHCHCIDINMHQYDTARVKCIAGLWEHVQWTFLAREKLFWSVI